MDLPAVLGHCVQLIFSHGMNRFRFLCFSSLALSGSRTMYDRGFNWVFAISEVEAKHFRRAHSSQSADGVVRVKVEEHVIDSRGGAVASALQ